MAERFDHMIRALLETRRRAPIIDVTGELLGDTVDGRPLTTEEIVSILRNWTAGDLGSLATSVGVLVHFLASWPSIQREVRTLVEAGDQVALVAAVEEILRIDDPFVSNRRVATRPVSLGGADMEEGDQVLLNWTAANRDPLVFGDPDRYDPRQERSAQPGVRHRPACVSREGPDADGTSGDARGAIGQDFLDRACSGPTASSGDAARGRLGACPDRAAITANVDQGNNRPPLRWGRWRGPT